MKEYLYSLVGQLLWLCSCFTVVSIPMVIATTCTMGDHDSWAASFFIMTPINIIIILGLLTIFKQTKISIIATIPHLIAIPFGFYVASQYFIGTTIQGHHFCSIYMSEMGFDSFGLEWWYRLWAPLQIIILIAFTYLVIRTWFPNLSIMSVNKAPKRDGYAAP